MILDRIKKLKFYRENTQIAEDGAKYIIAVPHILATLVNLWPMDSGKSQSIALFFIFISFVHQLSLFVYIFVNISDVDSSLISVSSITIGMQSMTKAIIFLYKSRHLNRLIKIVYEEFWPSNLRGHDTEREIRKDSSKQLLIFLIQYAAGTGFLLMYVVIPITKSNRQLPHSSWYPFDVLRTPAYEILIVLQFLFTFYVIQSSVCAYDFLYCAFCGNVVAQFRLLCEIVKMVGSGKEGDIVELLLMVPGVEYRPAFGQTDEEERRLLVICINHHQKLIAMSNQINKVFGNGHLMQLFVSIMGICTTCYRITTETSFSNVAFSVSFCVAHVTQLLMYCAVSNELSHWSVCFAGEAFKSQWYEKEYANIRKCLSIVMMRSQTAISMNTLGVFELNYVSFLAVMRFTFSLYAFLSRMAN